MQRVNTIENEIIRLKNSGIAYKLATKTNNTEILDEPLNDVLVLSYVPIDLEFEYQLLNRKASGIVWLPIKNTDIEEVIETLNNGGKWFSRVTLTRKITDTFDKKNYKVDINSFGLTKREKQIVEQLKLGYSNKEIARNKCISEATVKSHVKNILFKTNTKNRTSLLIQLSK
ncbi:response regulator transcription factor [Pseudoalteromonas sp. 2CM41L]|uniref:response regulator transcription factor n=1 Tax=unclassified Pseudoalteromonas TaxID=194690 RepID=UPI0020C1736D|nr:MULTISPECIES: response regulator transcription factor [unclassified Pseudoalteromonas]MCK8106526.1 response regulator transcription factor [Pseudoalteromonas sp. 2CM41L]MCK8136609.1 response regulator transcription factor [Pseudoalteromonas sp. 2CM28B]